MVKKPSISLVGPGSLASALALWLHAAGYRVEEIIARRTSLTRARALARRVRARAATVETAAFSADVIWICVPDDAIADCARDLAQRTDWKGRTVLHSSGALTSRELGPLRRPGATVASVHPMMTFVRDAQPPPPAGIFFAIEGEAKALAVVRRILHDLGGEVVSIKSGSKPLYHVLGAFASPLIIAELAVAERIAKAAGIPAAAARKTIGPILHKTLENYLAHGAGAAFSGPILRGDLGTIRKHLEVLKSVAGAREAYVALARVAVRDLPVRKRAQVQRLLKRA